MKWLNLLLLVLSMQAQASEPAALMAQALQADRQIPAMATLLVRAGQVSTVAVAGVRASDSADPVRDGDVWNIGSNGKAMTATLIARLVERGLLAWDTPLPQLLPELAAGMDAGYRKATLADLLSHRAGLAPNVDEAWIMARYGDPRSLVLQRRDYARLALQAPAVAVAPAPAAYSNSGSLIAASIAERVTGKDYETLMQAEVFGPLGMKVVFGATTRGQPLAHAQGKPLLGERAGNPLFMGPAGEMAMSLRDWARFAIDQMAGEQGKGKLLTGDGYRTLHAAQGGEPVALGWGIKSNFPAHAPMRLLIHAGSNGNWHALIALAPDTQDAILLTANAGDNTSAEQAHMGMLKTLLADLVR